MKAKKSLIGIGDSLTWGYYCNGEKSHPYSIKLNSLLKENNLNYEAKNYGVSGEMTLEMKERLIAQFESEFSGKDGAKFSSEDYIFMIFGGSNDIVQNIPITKIIENLKEMSVFLTSYNINHFVMTLPANECDLIYEDWVKKREEINNLIRKTWSEQKPAFLFDLDKKIKYLECSEEMRKDYWDDIIHFSVKGYDLLADKIFDRIKNLLI